MSYFEHELLDRTNMVTEIINTHLLEHTLMQEPERSDLQRIQFLIEEAQSLLCQAYQAIGNLPESFK